MIRHAIRLAATCSVVALSQAPVAAYADDAAASPAAESSGNTTIIVTATKRETDLQKTPIAISVIGADDIEKQHVQSLIDLASGSVPSLRVATFEARQSALTVGIRGIVPFDANQTARDQGVGVYLDGVYLGRQQGLNAALFDVKRIEVLRGPQGTLFGRNTEGGALNIVTASPTGEFGGRVVAGVGNYGQRNGEAHIDFPEFDHISIKVDGVYQHQDPTVKNPLVGEKGWNAYDRVGGRVQALWKPIDGFTANISFDKSRDENTPNYSQLVNYNPNGYAVSTLDYINSHGGKAASGTISPLAPIVDVTGDKRVKTADVGVPQQYSVDRTQGIMGNLSYEISPELTVRSITAWRQVDTDQYDNSGGPARTVFLPNAKFSRYSLSFLSQRQFSQELQLVGSLPQVDFVAGAFYFNEHANENAATPSSNLWNADGTGYTVLSPIVTGPVTSNNQGWDDTSLFIQRDSHAKAQSIAAFAQATYTPAGLDQLHLTAGGRYTHDKRDGALDMVNGVAVNDILRFRKDRFDPMVTLAFDATQDINLYAKYATGYRAGGANDRSQTFAAFGPESVKSYEVGAKMMFLDRMVRLNLAGYIMDRTGTQVDFDNVNNDPTSPYFNLHTQETINAPGTTKIRGVEAELSVRPMDNLTLGASYAYTYTHVPKTLNPFLSTDTNPVYQNVFIVYTPKNAAAGYIDYSIPVGVRDESVLFHLDAAYSDPQYSFEDEDTKTQSSFIVNGRIALADIPLTDGGSKLTVSLWSRNLLNETNIYRRSAANSKYTTDPKTGVRNYAGVLGDYANFNPPRTFGVEGTVSF
ncbi:iron complex outermembrane receptor protein [Novosphingobium sp. PhB165]|uniref:TonB-dependent receptor n=1 Tax=Novosphingobium sp. PhB165 TaxID=2485105 RepID=UPI0010460FCB|nr:TonB-dependent receptor [Novosphingobium sp. PhB165]TCM14965.1 iron complex outermembrane receptor protein [Novosphingobium sp. PhB165]